MKNVITKKSQSWQNRNGENLEKPGAFVSLRKKTKSDSSTFEKGSVSVGFFGTFFSLVVLAVFSASAYLYQVNSLIAKGYEIKEIENKIKDLEKENRKMKIREVELRSMYAIEKSSQNLNMIGPEEISYIEIGGPVAMMK